MGAPEPDELMARSYFGWQGSGKRPPREELAAALQRYEERCGRRPALVLVFERDGQEVPEGVALVVAPAILADPGKIFLWPPPGRR